MPQYRKKPIIINAERTLVEQQMETLEGRMTANPGDYIITGIAGEIYPCKPEIFEASYERVDENEPLDSNTFAYASGPTCSAGQLPTILVSEQELRSWSGHGTVTPIK